MAKSSVAESGAEASGTAESTTQETHTSGRFAASVRGFLHRQRDDLIRDGLVGLFFAFIAFVLAASWDGRMAARQEQLEETRLANQQMLENTRFIREVSLAGGEKPFQGLHLQNAQLAYLDLADANLTDSNLSGAYLVATDLTDATLVRTRLNSADLAEADLIDATLFEVDLRGAFLSGATLTGAELREVCYDDETVWPDGFNPPEPVCDQ